MNAEPTLCGSPAPARGRPCAGAFETAAPEPSPGRVWPGRCTSTQALSEPNAEGPPKSNARSLQGRNRTNNCGGVFSRGLLFSEGRNRRRKWTGPPSSSGKSTAGCGVAGDDLLWDEIGGWCPRCRGADEQEIIDRIIEAGGEEQGND